LHRHAYNPACMEGAVAVALPGPSLQEVLAGHDAHPSWVSTKQRRAPRQKCQKQKSPPQKAKQAPTSRPLCVCLQHSHDAYLCRQSYVTQESCSMRANYAEDDAVLTMHMATLRQKIPCCHSLLSARAKKRIQQAKRPSASINE